VLRLYLLHLHIVQISCVLMNEHSTQQNTSAMRAVDT